eukprot:CAMPEP_0116938082 /NCGR_PEP_ID=MMETSP0467-20121206/31896_1 /TAXON_ID=283647 /ORGANISM="Mesodinium pulex, Strain SPMC105" /LENGTH=126 /DNA_ID=CAMNT_0004620037 /DNA_START=206 /DNA_END=586 /DNA_ORIENTATION=+
MTDVKSAIKNKVGPVLIRKSKSNDDLENKDPSHNKKVESNLEKVSEFLDKKLGEQNEGKISTTGLAKQFLFQLKAKLATVGVKVKIDSIDMKIFKHFTPKNRILYVNLSTKLWVKDITKDNGVMHI